MKLCLIDNAVYYQLGTNYLIYLCKREVFETLTACEIRDLVIKTLTAIRGNNKSERVH